MDEDPSELDEAALGELREDLGDAFGPFVERFLSSAGEALDALDAELARGATAEAAARAHSLKGSAGYLGATALAEALGGLQRAGERGDAAQAGVLARAARERLQRVLPRLAACAREP